MSLDPLRCAVHDRADLEHRFHRLPGFFGTHQLLVGQSKILRTKLLIVALDDPASIPLLFLPDGALVDPEFSALELPQIKTVPAMSSNGKFYDLSIRLLLRPLRWWLRPVFAFQ